MSEQNWRESDWSNDANANAVFEAIEPVANGFSDQGHDLYLVGGVVRDLLLSRAMGAATSEAPRRNDTPLFNDIDLTTDARPDVTTSILRPAATALWLQGERFGTIGATVNGHDLEITTYRAESYESTSRNPVVAFGDDLQVDLSRRDFSINAMAIDATTGELMDPFGGAADLAARVLRTPLDPSISFTDDPLRMMRAARFIPRFGLRVDPGVSAAVVEHLERLSIVSAERIHDEFERLLALPEPELGFAFLVDTGLLAMVAPELDVDRWADAARRASAGVDSLDGADRTGRTLVRRSGFCATIGDDAEAFLRNRRYSSAMRTATVKVAAAATAITAAPDSLVHDQTLRRLAHEVGLDHVSAVLETAVLLGTPAAAVDDAKSHLARLTESEDLNDFSSPIAGGEIIKLMGLTPGPEVGAIVQRLLEHRLENGPLTRDETGDLLGTWRAEPDQPA